MGFTNVAGVPGAVGINVDKDEQRSFRRGVDLSSYGPDSPVRVRVGSYVEAEGLTGDEPELRPFLMICPDRAPSVSMSHMQWNITKRLADAAWDWFEREFLPAATAAPPERAPADGAPEPDVTFSEPVRLPDGSGFFTGTFPLPKDHWLYADHENEPPMPMRIGQGAARDVLAKQIQAAARFAVRASTTNGKEKDFDPDAMVQNMIVGLLGYWTEDGLSRLT